MTEPMTTGDKVQTAAFTTLIALSWIVAFVFGVLVGLRAAAMRLPLLLLLFTLSPSMASAQGKAFVVSEWAVMGSHALDAAATQRCLGAGRCREINPWLARYDSPVGFTAAKVTVASLQLWAVRKFRPSHPKLAAVANYAIAAGFTAIAIRNERIGR